MRPCFSRSGQLCSAASTAGLREMSLDLCSVRDSGRQHGQDEGTTVGGLKPLHRFLKGQPKIAGIVVLILGVSLFCVTVAILTNFQVDDRWFHVLPCLMLSAMFIASGILYILTENNPTKKTVTISMALSIISVLFTLWLVSQSVHHFRYFHFDGGFEQYDNITETVTVWSSHYMKVGSAVEAVFKFNSSVGGVICLVMSILAGAALRSTKSQAIVLMTTTATEEPKH